jgi:hypothetical protein
MLGWIALDAKASGSEGRSWLRLQKRSPPRHYEVVRVFEKLLGRAVPALAQSQRSAKR